MREAIVFESRHRAHAHSFTRVPSLSLWQTKGFSDQMKSHVPHSCRDLTYLAQIQDRPGWTLADLEAAVRETAAQSARRRGRADDYYEIVGCIAGGEAGVDLADAFSEYLGVMSNGAREWRMLLLVG
jgi:hypothetical protein